MTDRHPLAWAPPLVVGAAGAVAAELSVGLLLYSGPGFTRALTLVLATLLVALALGLGMAPGPGRDPTTALRRAWLLHLVVFTGAAVTAGAWSLAGGFASSGLSRGLGLALLGGLPLYGTGYLLGAMGAARRADGAPSPAPVAALGGALGALATGFLFLSAFSPPAMLLACLLPLSLAALLHGSVRDRRAEGDEEVLEERDSAFGQVRVVGAPHGRGVRQEVRVLENGRLRGGRRADGSPLRAWEDAVPALLPDGGAALVVGGGAAALVGGLLRTGHRVELVDRNPEILAAARRVLDLPEAGDGFSARCVAPGGTLLAPLPARSVVVLEAAAVAPGDPLPVPATTLLRTLDDALVPGGVLVLAGLRSDAVRPGSGPMAALRSALGDRLPVRTAFRRGDEALLVLTSGAPPLAELEGWDRIEAAG